MAEAQPRALGRQQAGALDGVERRRAPTPTPLGGAQQRPDLAAVVGRREQEHPSRVVGERRRTRAMKARSMPLVQRQVEAQRRAAGALVVGEGAGQLEQGERVAAGDADELVAHDRGQAAVDGSGAGSSAPLSPPSRSSGSPCASNERASPSRAPMSTRDRVGLQPAGDEDERVGRRAVEPVGVVDDAQQRLLLGRRR